MIMKHGWRHADPAVTYTSRYPSFDDVPPLDGTLYLDLGARQADARDLGRIVERVPCAVLRPASVGDIAAMIRYCRRRGIKIYNPCGEDD